MGGPLYLYDEEEKGVVQLSLDSNGGYLGVKDKEGKTVASLAADENGIREVGSLERGRGGADTEARTLRVASLWTIQKTPGEPSMAARLVSSKTATSRSLSGPRRLR